MGFLTALRFLTVLPVPGKALVTDRRLGQATGWYPLVGVIVGGALFGCALGSARLFNPLPSAAFAITVWVVLTRGLHLDGLADSFDGLMGGATLERRLAIMKDSRVGALGVLALCLCLALKLSLVFSALAEGRPQALLLAPVLGRWAMLAAIFSFPAAPTGGMGSRVKSHCTWLQLALGSAITLAWVWLLRGWGGFAAIGAAALAAGAFGLYCLRRLGGLTGDTYGAICEIAEVAALAAAAPLLPR